MFAPPQVKPKSEVIRPPIGSHLVIGAVSDRLERDADRRAEQALALPAGTAGRRVPNSVRSDVTGAASQRVASSVSGVVASGGAPLEHGPRQDMEKRFGEDFSHVRIHTEANAARSAADVGARAYTVGSNIVFGERESPSDRRLLAHELAHVLQKTGAQPMLLRQPKPSKPKRGVDKPAPKPTTAYPEWVPADSVVELRWVNYDTWGIKLSGRTSVESARALLWREWFPTDIAPMKLEVAMLEPVELGWFTISRLAFWHLEYMDPSIAALFRERGLIDEVKDSPELAKARDAFRKHNSDLGHWRHSAVHMALKRATRGNEDLMLAFYRHYSTHDLESDEDVDGFATTSSGDTELNSRVLMLEKNPKHTSDPLSLLGGVLIHELVHGPHGPKELGGQVTQLRKEAKAYAIELLLSERMGDAKRAANITKQWHSNDSLIMGTGADKIFNRSYRIISDLYDIIDSRGGAEAAAARRMSIEFISKNEADYGQELRHFIARNGH